MAEGRRGPPPPGVRPSSAPLHPSTLWTRGLEAAVRCKCRLWRRGPGWGGEVHRVLAVAGLRRRNARNLWQGNAGGRQGVADAALSLRILPEALSLAMERGRRRRGLDTREVAWPSRRRADVQDCGWDRAFQRRLGGDGRLGFGKRRFRVDRHLHASDRMDCDRKVAQKCC